MIYLLIGQKGSGKTFIGEFLEREFGIKFIRVEDWAKSIKRNRSLENQSYLRDVFATIETGVRMALLEHKSLTFESTGLTYHFDDMLESLRSDFRVVIIGVRADEEICLQRIKHRDQSVHIKVADEQIVNINEAVRAKNLSVDFTIDNRSTTETELREELSKIIEQTKNQT